MRVRYVPAEGQPFRLAERSGGEIYMSPEEAQIGKRVRVRKDHRKAEMRGLEGTIAKRWGDPGYPALDVILDDGDWQLFWFHELEPMDEDDRGARRRNGVTAGPMHPVANESRRTEVRMEA